MPDSLTDRLRERTGEAREQVGPQARRQAELQGTMLREAGQRVADAGQRVGQAASGARERLASDADGTPVSERAAGAARSLMDTLEWEPSPQGQQQTQDEPIQFGVTATHGWDDATLTAEETVPGLDVLPTVDPELVPDDSMDPPEHDMAMVGWRQYD